MSDRANILKLSKILLPKIKLQLVKNKKLTGRGLKLPGEKQGNTPVSKRISRAELQREVLKALRSPAIIKLLKPKGVQQGKGILAEVIKSVAPIIVSELFKLGKSLFAKKSTRSKKKRVKG